MDEITKEQYEYALARIESLLPLVSDESPATDGNALELSIMSEIVIAYEKKHFPIGKHITTQQVPSSMYEVATL